ncbi:hypothetical protein O6H91_15G044600 [Diphasiastrum complanatum]|uniref:Uncharacterized protein n=1 Tax=Diphasiastrum complanatum TaxID=34168 RepID=A0ACC2BHV8_DIPCM|nr:hypothetical protein O6H91_15G044600 [Diphasiastrum complanatum]
MTSFPDEVLEYVLKFITTHKDRNAVSLVCKAWYSVEGWNRQSVFIGNCYAVSPEILINRFPRIKTMTLKGRPRFADFNLFPQDWGAYLHPWVVTMAARYPWLEELRLKRMTVSDECLVMLAHAFPNFRVLVLTSCDGFSTDGLAAIAGHCSVVDFDALEKLVERCTSLKSLKLNKGVSLEQLQRLLVRAPQLCDLGTGSYSQQLKWTQYAELQTAITNCKDLRSLSGFWDVAPVFVPSLYPIGRNLTTLNLSYATIRGNVLMKLVSHCPNLKRLWVQDFVEDKGLQAVGMNCKELQELRVFPVDPLGHGYVTEIGLVAISEGCPNLSSVLYFCRQCTNAAIIAVAKNCPNLTRFRLCIITPQRPDHETGEPMDEAFGAIVKHCKDLRRLALSGLLTDKAFEYIGLYGKRLQTLSVAFAGDSDLAMQYVLNGCPNLRKLEIRDSPFGDAALLSGLHRYESMRFLWMSACNITLIGCGWLANQLPRLNVEVIKENENSRDLTIEKLYAYRSVAGPRSDAPHCVVTL